MARLLLLPCLVLCVAASAAAQQATPATTPSVERGWLTINVGGGPGPKGFSDTVQSPLYQETETIKTNYPDGTAVIVSGAGGVRIWKHLSAGLGVSHWSRTADATLEASLPHPFFDNQPRTIQGTTSTTRHEITTDFKIGWTLDLSSRVHLLLTGGPSIINVRQTIVTGVKYAESYPYDTAQFTSAETTEARHGIAGVNAAADLSWMFARHVGAGGIVQVTHGTVKLPVNGRTVRTDAGAVQAGGGIRFSF